MYLYRVLLWSVLLLSTAASLRSQTAATDSSNAVATIKTKLQIVLVDVVVTNNKGEPVPSLRREDFEIFEDNKPQTVSTFEEHRGVPLTQIKLPPMPLGVYKYLRTGIYDLDSDAAGTLGFPLGPASPSVALSK